MENEETKQLVILGNGFDLKLGLETKFEDYMKRFHFDEKKKLDDLFKELINLSSFNVENLEKSNMDEECFGYKVDEIIDYIDNIEINSEEKKLVSNFYIKAMRNQLESNAIHEVERWKNLDSKNSIKYDNRIELLKRLSEEMLNRYKTNDNTADKSKKQLNFWDLYFLYLRKDEVTLNEHSNWSDVEYQILKFYKGSDNESAKYNELIDSKNKYLTIIFETLTDGKISLNNVDEFLYGALCSFSQNFVNYLNNIYTQNYNKNDNASYIRKGGREDLVDNIANNSKYELLNFNYTDAKGNKCVKQIHIHGDKDKVDEIPIIGINAEDLTVNKEHAFKLTKQYQLISNENNRIEKLDLENIDKIIFYGHSLALADYQYFRNIFDRINLVKSSVQLIFKYSKGYENYDSIFKLLDRYSQDIDIDVTTTLTLENRLKVEEIPD